MAINQQKEASALEVQTLVELTENELKNYFEFSVLPQNCIRWIGVTINKPEEWAKHLILNGCPDFNTIDELSKEFDPIISYEDTGDIDWEWCEDEGHIMEVLSDTYNFDDYGQLKNSQTMKKEELLHTLFSEDSNIPQAVVYRCEITTEDLYGIFLESFLEEFGDLQIWTSQETDEIFTKMWEEKKDDFYQAGPPNQWGWEHAEIIHDWVKNYGE